MKNYFILVLICFSFIGCATEISRPSQVELVEEIIELTGHTQLPVDNAYYLENAHLTKTEKVFDDSERTFVQFEDSLPSGLRIFDQNGSPLNFESFDKYVILDGIFSGILIYSMTEYTYAAPRNLLSFLNKKLENETESVPVRINAQSINDINSDYGFEHISTIFNDLPFDLVRIYFKTGQANVTLSSAAKKQLHNLSSKATSVSIKGYTDSQGDRSHNKLLAEKRAKFASSLVQSFGVPSDDINSEFFAGRYIENNNNEKGRAKNRRVELVFYSE